MEGVDEEGEGDGGMYFHGFYSTGVFTDYCVQAKVKKNVETDTVGDKIGRIHLGRQDLSELQTRKMKGLKRGRDAETEAEDGAEEEDIVSEDEEAVEGGVEVKRARLE